MHGVETARHVQLHYFIELVSRSFPSRFPDGPRTTGHVDQDINAAESLQRLRGEGFRLGRLSHIA